MQKPREHLARTSSRRRGSCVFSFRLGTRNLRLPTAASNHRRCTHTHKHTGPNTQRSTRESLIHSHSQNQNTNTQPHRGTTTRWSIFSENAAVRVVAAAAASFSHRRENLEPPAGGGSVFTAARKEITAERPATHTPRIPLPCF